MLTLSGRPGRPAVTTTVLLLPFIMAEWQTLCKSAGINVCASSQLSASEPIVELRWLPTIRHGDTVLFSRWRPPSKEFC